MTDGGEAFMPDDRSVADSTSTWGVVNVDTAELADPTEDLKVPSSKLPWAICMCAIVVRISILTFFRSFRKWWPYDRLHSPIS